MKFKAKVYWWLHLIFLAMVVTNIGAIVIAFSGNLAAIIIAATFTPINIFIVPMWLNSYYMVADGVLRVRFGWMKFSDIDVDRITDIAEIINPVNEINAPCFTLRQLDISYRWKNGNYNDSIRIMPAEKQEFIDYLKSLNRDIVVHDGTRPMSRGAKLILFISAIILILSLIGTGILFIVGESEPVVTISGDSVRISAMYGTTVALDHITDVALLDQSMRDIGAGNRTNGYNGGAWRGHFTAGLLFVRPNSAPTIRITRRVGADIFLSYRDGARTEAVYNELAAAVR
jgi:hypothetical protein